MVSSQEKQVLAGTLQGFSPHQVQDKVCVLSGFPQAAALTLTASATPNVVESSSQVLAICFLQGASSVSCSRSSIFRDVEQDVWDAGSLATLVSYAWRGQGVYKPMFLLYFFGP